MPAVRLLASIGYVFDDADADADDDDDNNNNNNNNNNKLCAWRHSMPAAPAS